LSSSARSYIDAGIKLLDSNNWETQYRLSLSLFEMSASVSCITGDTATMYSCLQKVMDNARTIDDTLVASSLLAKLLVYNHQFDDARKNCRDILVHLGEEVPADVSLSQALDELSSAQTVLRNMTPGQIEALPPMSDRRKLDAMKFLNMLCNASHLSKPLLLPVLSCRMINLTLRHGFCEDSIVGIATAGWCVVSLASSPASTVPQHIPLTSSVVETVSLHG
jgi:predicted ATPase